jgi:hypothetical protein
MSEMEKLKELARAVESAEKAVRGWEMAPASPEARVSLDLARARWLDAEVRYRSAVSTFNEETHE